MAFPPGITTMVLPCTKDVPVGSGFFTDLALVFLYDRTSLLLAFTCYFSRECAPPAPEDGWFWSAGSPSYEHLQRASHAYHHTDGYVSAKQASAAWVVVVDALATMCLLRLRCLADTNFVLLPAPPSSPSSSAGPAVPLTPRLAADPVLSGLTSPHHDYPGDATA